MSYDFGNLECNLDDETGRSVISIAEHARSSTDGTPFNMTPLRNKKIVAKT